MHLSFKKMKYRLLLLTIFLISIANACDENVAFIGYVNWSNGTPAGGVTVRIINPVNSSDISTTTTETVDEGEWDSNANNWWDDCPETGDLVTVEAILGTRYDETTFYYNNSSEVFAIGPINLTLPVDIIISTTLYQAPIWFCDSANPDSLTPPKTDHPADDGSPDCTGGTPGPNGFPTNLTIEGATTVNTNLTIKGTRFNHTNPSYYFEVDNLSYNNLSSPSGKVAMTESYPEPPPFADWIKLPKGTKVGPFNRSIYFWIDVPLGQYAGNYSSNIAINTSQWIPNP
jgi:hypothetical protein